MAPRPDVSEERKAQILEAATRVFARTGFHKARMEDIAAEAGLSKGTLYLYFKGKDDIIRTLLEHLYQRAIGPLPAALEAEGPVSERMRLATGMVVAEMQKLMRSLPLTFEFYAVAARQESVRQFLKEYFAESYNIVAALIQQGIDSGEFRQVDTYAVAITVGALFEGLGVLCMVDPDSVDWEKHTEAALDLLLHGLLIKKGG